MQSKQIAKSAGMSAAKSVLLGLASNGFLTFVMQVVDKISNVPSIYIKENPNITIEEFLEKFSEFNKNLSNANLVATFGVFGVALFTFLVTYLLMNWIKTGHCLPTESNPQVMDATTHEQINDSDAAPLPTQNSWKDNAKTAVLPLLIGAAVWGFICLIRSSGDRNLASYLADEASSLGEVDSTWSFIINSNIIFASVLIGMGLAGSLTFIAARQTQTPFWRRSNNTNLNEESRLVALPAKEEDKTSITPANR